MKKITVLVVDDSAVVRQTLTRSLEKDPAIQSVDSASDPIFAMQKMNSHWPDVVILDVEMPRMDGITFLRKIMEFRPTPVIICSSLTEEGAETTMEALSAGAIEIITKPKIGVKGFLSDSAEHLIESVKAAAVSRVAHDSRANRSRSGSGAAAASKHLANFAEKESGSGKAQRRMKTTDRIIAVGTSTGGTQALETLLKEMPPLAPPMVIVQHMPEKFTAAFAARLNQLCEHIEVREAKDGDEVFPGRAIIARGNIHMQLHRSGARYYVELKDGPPISRHKPSVDVLFRSTAQAAGGNAIGVILTGMGDDGAQGLFEMHEAGALTVAQDEESCVVFGMPKEAIKKGAVDEILPLNEIRPFLLALTKDK